MSRLLEFHHSARRELTTIHRYYRVRNSQAADHFLVRFDDAIQRVKTGPESMPRLKRDYRWCRVRRFPYQIVFRIEPDASIFVIAIAHLKRRSGYWRNRK